MDTSEEIVLAMNNRLKRNLSRIDRMKLFLCLFVSLIILASTNPAVAEGSYVKFTPKLQRAYFEIQKLRIQTARNLIEEERELNKGNVLIAYLENYADMHYLMISEDRTAYKRLIEYEDVRLSAVGKLPDASPYKKLFQAEIRLHWAFAKIKFGNEVSGAWEVIKAYKLLDENRKKFPSFIPTLKSLGFLHVLIGSVPENYTWVTKVLGLRGNIDQGIKEIQTVVLQEPFYRQEAELMDLLLHAYTLELGEKQLAKVKQLPKDHPDNLLLHFFATTILMKEGNSKDASWYLHEAPSGSGYISFPFLHYLCGEIALQQGKYDSAFNWYTAFQKEYKGFNYIKDSNLKMFMCKWLSNQDSEALPFIKRIENSGSAIIEADKLALRMAEEYKSGKMTSQQKSLYKSRYATDGGYLHEAKEFLSVVSESSFTSLAEKTEFNYRKGRILQKSEKKNEAIPYLNRAVEISKGSSIGFGASAALQLGYIYKEDGQKDKAILCFKKAMSYKKYEYKNSIDSKARAALTAMGQ
jgi:tetratricopeptide (TPR) repeat protein